MMTETIIRTKMVIIIGTIMFMALVQLDLVASAVATGSGRAVVGFPDNKSPISPNAPPKSPVTTVDAPDIPDTAPHMPETIDDCALPMILFFSSFFFFRDFFKIRKKNATFSLFKFKKKGRR